MPTDNSTTSQANDDARTYAERYLPLASLVHPVDRPKGTRNGVALKPVFKRPTILRGGCQLFRFSDYRQSI